MYRLLSLLTKLGQDPETSELIRVCTFLFRSEHSVYGDVVYVFGDLFQHPEIVRDFMSAGSTVMGDQGGVCSLPGSVIHHGPACKSSRTVIFFSAKHPHAEKAYDPVGDSSDPRDPPRRTFIIDRDSDPRHPPPHATHAPHRSRQ